MGFGESVELGGLKVAEKAVGEQVGQNIVSVLVPGSSRRTRSPAEDHLEPRIRRVAGEKFVGIDVEIGGMVDCQQLHLIEINDLFERLHEAEAQLDRPFPEWQLRSTLMYSVGRGMSR